MFFRRRERPSLRQALDHIEQAVAILREHWRDRAFHPTHEDLKQALAMERTLSHLTEAAGRLVIRLERRFHGEPEINRDKWIGWEER